MSDTEPKPNQKRGRLTKGVLVGTAAGLAMKLGLVDTQGPLRVDPAFASDHPDAAKIEKGGDFHKRLEILRTGPQDLVNVVVTFTLPKGHGYDYFTFVPDERFPQSGSVGPDNVTRYCTGNGFRYIKNLHGKKGNDWLEFMDATSIESEPDHSIELQQGHAYDSINALFVSVHKMPPDIKFWVNKKIGFDVDNKTYRAKVDQNQRFVIPQNTSFASSATMLENTTYKSRTLDLPALGYHQIPWSQVGKG